MPLQLCERLLAHQFMLLPPFFFLSHCSRHRSLVLVSTLDGQISALDTGVGQGHVLWSIPSPSGPLFSSSLTNVEFKDDSGSYRLVPALDGNLYSWREGKLQVGDYRIDLVFSLRMILSANGVHSSSAFDVLFCGPYCQTDGDSTSK